MTIKTKLSLGLAFLFAIILLMGGLWAYFTQRLAAASNQIIRDNYESVQYANGMFHALDEMNKDLTLALLRSRSLTDSSFSPLNSPKYQQDVQAFEKNLLAEEKNLTEVGERESATALRKSFEALKTMVVVPGKQPLLPEPFYLGELVPRERAVRDGIMRISEINLEAMNRKNSLAQQQANEALSLLSLIGTLCFIVTFTFILNFPGYIANFPATLPTPFPNSRMVFARLPTATTRSGFTSNRMMNLVRWPPLLTPWPGNSMSMNTAIWPNYSLKSNAWTP